MSKKNLVYIFITVIVLSLVLFAFIREYLKQEIIYSRFQMGTIVEITLREDAPEKVESAFKEIERLEKILSHYREDSDVSGITRDSGKGPVRVSPEVIDVIEAALKISELTDGAFDPTIGALKAWDFSGDKNRLPQKGEIEKHIELVNWREVSFDRNSSTIRLNRKGMRLDLGGVAKGYIVGRALDVLKRQGIDWAIIKAGGDMMVYKKDKTGKPFIIGIQHPRDKGKLLGRLLIHGGSVGTSGDYERFFIKDKVRYHHIIDPSTGYPADKSRSVTIVSEDPALTDALSTGVFVLGPEKGMKLIETLEGVEGIIVDGKGEVFISSGLKGVFEPL